MFNKTKYSTKVTALKPLAVTAFQIVALVLFMLSLTAVTEARESTYSYEEMSLDLYRLQEDYPGIIQRIAAGETPSGQVMWGAKIGSGDKSLLIAAAHDARRWDGSKYLAEITRKYAQAIDSRNRVAGYNARRLFNDTAVYIVPMVNPDGVALQQEGLSAFSSNSHTFLRRLNNGRSNYSSWSANALGTELLEEGYGRQPSPEAKIIKALAKELNPEAAVIIESARDIVKSSDGQIKNADILAQEVNKLLDFREVKGHDKDSFCSWFEEYFEKPALEIGVPDLDSEGSSALGLLLAEQIHILDFSKMKMKNVSSPSITIPDAPFWPIDRNASQRITSPFGYRSHPITGERNSFHRGLDIAAVTGTAVHTIYDGVATHVGPSGGYGNSVVIVHKGKDDSKHFISVYAHLHSIDVRAGQVVKRGAVIGTVGATGKTTGPHLHFEIRRNYRAIDPLNYFGKYWSS